MAIGSVVNAVTRLTLLSLVNATNKYLSIIIDTFSRFLFIEYLLNYEQVLARQIIEYRRLFYYCCYFCFFIVIVAVR